MSTPIPGEGGLTNIEGPELELFGLVESLTEATADFLQAANDYVEDPSAEQNTELLNACNDSTVAFNKCVRNVAAGELTEETFQLAAGIFADTVVSRHYGLLEIFEDLKLRPPDREELILAFSDYAEMATEEFEFVNEVVDDFAVLLEKDVKRFKKKAQKEQRQQRAAGFVVEICTEPLDYEEEGGQRGEFYAFSVTPRLKNVHTPQITPDVLLTVSTEAATNGEVWVPAEITEGAPDEDTRLDLIADFLHDSLSKVVNPLGQLSLQIGWERTVRETDENK